MGKVTITHPDGRTAEVSEAAARVHVKKGWTRTDGAELVEEPAGHDHQPEPTTDAPEGDDDPVQED